jgi:transcriptional regulator with XRE-family HTH domain
VPGIGTGRRAHRVTGSSLAGVSKDTFWRLESGVSTNAHPSTIRKLAGAFDVAPSELAIR